MKLWRRVVTFLLRQDVAKPEVPPTAEVIREAKETLRDLREVRRFEILIRRR